MSCCDNKQKWLARRDATLSRRPASQIFGHTKYCAILARIDKAVQELFVLARAQISPSQKASPKAISELRRLRNGINSPCKYHKNKLITGSYKDNAITKM
jgi:hypothetical protein